MTRSAPRLRFSLPALLLTACTPLALAGEVSTADGTGADSQVMGYGNDRETLTKGGAASIEVRGHDFSGNCYYGVLRMDLSGAEGVAEAKEATLTLTVTGEKTTPGTLTLFGLDDGYAAGADESGKPEVAEADYEEGSGNWVAASGDAELTGDNAPGLREKVAGLGAFNWFGSPFTELGSVEVAEDAKEVVFGPSAELAAFLKADTNGTAVLYLASDDVFVQLGAKRVASRPFSRTTDLRVFSFSSRRTAVSRLTRPDRR